MHKITKILIILYMGFSSSFLLAAENYIYKFKDANGKIVYTDRMPANEKGQFVVLSSKSGIIKKVVEKELTEDDIEKRDADKIQEKKIVEKTDLQRKKDVSLLSSYSSSDEIDKMKKYELDQIDQGIKNNIDNIASLKDKLAILELNKNQTPNNKNIEIEYEKATSNLATIQEMLDSNKKMYNEREKKYDDDKVRYLEILKEMSNNDKKSVTQ